MMRGYASEQQNSLKNAGSILLMLLPFLGPEFLLRSSPINITLKLRTVFCHQSKTTFIVSCLTANCHGEEFKSLLSFCN